MRVVVRVNGKEINQIRAAERSPKRLASAVQVRPWPPHFQTLTDIPKTSFIPFHSKTLVRRDSPLGQNRLWTRLGVLSIPLVETNFQAPRVVGLPVRPKAKREGRGRTAHHEDARVSTVRKAS